MGALLELMSAGHKREFKAQSFSILLMWRNVVKPTRKMELDNKMGIPPNDGPSCRVCTNHMDCSGEFFVLCISGANSTMSEEGNVSNLNNYTVKQIADCISVHLCWST
eukprot:TRINITY_DN18754_c0_g1_i1.p1 TRINITY_DN18754_c0_g1~~TRINITY_DN18754_c0_g1_i1.p1  ORF type:complete len:108 (-),score=8.46 TRINITY_DN18754_c0_g1_i1:214-537(-)